MRLCASRPGAGAAERPVDADRGVTSSVAGNVMTVNQTVQRGIANWNSFSIGSDATVNVQQPNASAVLLNRVTGESSSSINGTLNANGRVYLINPNGILFGQGARVNVGGIVASTLDLAGATEAERNNAFLAGGAMKFANPGPNSGTVTVDPGASITANGNGGRGGIVVLIGNSVSNEGEIRAPGGSVALAAGSQVTLDPVGDGLTTLRVDAGALEGRLAGRVTNVGDIQADGGRVLLLTQETWGLIVNGIYSDGSDVPAAGHIQARGGEIVLDAGTGGVQVRSGALDVGGAGSANGGKVAVRGTDVALTGQIAADSGPGGGRGGQIQVQAGNDLTLDGPLSARGHSGGGQIETSGSSFYITDRFAVDASTTSGTAGTWVLDPQDVDIVHGSPPPSPSANTLYDSTVNTALDTGTSVTVATPAGGSPTTGDVMFHDGVAIARGATGAPVNFQVDAYRSIRTETSNVTIESSPGAGALNVFLNADADNNGPAVGGGKSVSTARF
ncbi:filamentous hemagglutinin N-terminal domain-containing protein [Ottowia pentelensis]|uniref:two-partner secretion domain-containing protein n=1 Tax=Ottowia pentelensis TaxID=511108 RepID=UPI003632F2B5